MTNLRLSHRGVCPAVCRVCGPRQCISQTPHFAISVASLVQRCKSKPSFYHVSNARGRRAECAAVVPSCSGACCGSASVHDLASRRTKADGVGGHNLHHGVVVLRPLAFAVEDQQALDRRDVRLQDARGRRASVTRSPRAAGEAARKGPCPWCPKLCRSRNRSTAHRFQVRLCPIWIGAEPGERSG